MKYIKVEKMNINLHICMIYANQWYIYRYKEHGYDELHHFYRTPKEIL